jgi:formamidopyrimidine-DNA glycosylase
MPEIPEMEIYKNFLNQYIGGKQVTAVRVERPRSINTDIGEFTGSVRGAVIYKTERRAKFLILRLNNNLHLLTHMMLDGRLFYGPPGLDVPPDAGGPKDGQLPGKPYIVLGLSDNHSLYFCELGLGYLHLLDDSELARETAGLGIEPLGPEYTWEKFNGLLTGRRGKIKPFLMEQKNLAGLGNAYSNEVLFAGGILPDRPVSSLEEGEKRRLYEVIPETLKAAVRLGGYIEEPFTAGDSLSGGFIPHFRVYDRGDEPCLVCGTPISKTKLSGRWTFYCVQCQQ